MLLSKILKENFWKLAVLDGRGNGKITSIWYVRSCEVLTTVLLQLEIMWDWSVITDASEELTA